MIKQIFTLDYAADRVFGLDLMRTIAILLVVVAHGNFILAGLIPGQVMQWLNAPIMDGVTLFFVLSGYLIGGILIRSFERESATPRLLHHFWIRRWYRTLPNYFMILAILTTYSVAVNDVQLRDIGPYALFLQNFASPHPQFFPEAWSLSVEEWFYILLPMALLLLRMAQLSTRAATLALCIGGIVFSLALRHYRFVHMDIQNIIEWDLLLRKQVVTRMDSLLYGVLAAWTLYYHRHWWLRWKKPLLVLGLVLLGGHRVAEVMLLRYQLDFSLYYCVISFAVMPIAAALLLPFLSTLHVKSNRWIRLITLISLISYSLYLTHLSLVLQILVPLAADLLPASFDKVTLTFFKYVVYWGFSLLLSIVIYKYFETPMLALRERHADKHSDDGTRIRRATGGR